MVITEKKSVDDGIKTQLQHNTGFYLIKVNNKPIFLLRNINRRIINNIGVTSTISS